MTPALHQQSPALRLELRPSAALVAYAELLALPAAEVECEIAREVAENPALELPDVLGRCPRCGSAPSAGHPRWCATGGASGVGDRLAAVPAARSTSDALLAEVRLLLPACDHAIAEYVIGSLDRHGFLREETAAIAMALGVRPVRVDRVVGALREAGPPGICARSARECLALQLERLAADGVPSHPLAKTLVDHHLDAIAAGRQSAVAAALGVDRAEVAAGLAFIREHLQPYPADGLDAPQPIPPVIPDFVFERAGARSRFDVRLTEPERFRLTIHPLYAAGGPSPELAHARALLARLGERWQTMLRVGREVAERQRDFLVHGPERLHPLTRAEVAAAIGVHESTVSRATSGRHVLLPTGGVAPFAVFFDAAAPARAALEQLIAGEPRPLSDTELAAALAQRGFSVARRTVAKYRERLGIPAQALR